MATPSKPGTSSGRSASARKAAATRRRATERRSSTARKAAATRARRGKAGGTSAARTPSGGMTAEKRDSLDARKFAFPKERKEPLDDAKHVRNAIARFDQVEGVSEKKKDKAWKRIKKAAKRYDIEVSAKSWRDLGKSKTSTAKGSEKKKKKKK